MRAIPFILLCLKILPEKLGNLGQLSFLVYQIEFLIQVSSILLEFGD